MYQYMSTRSYIIDGCYTVTKDGALDISNQADEKEVQHLIDELIRRGYNIPTAEDETTASEDKENSLTVEMPLELVNKPALERLRKIVENKGELFKTAFKTDNLDIIVDEEKVCLLNVRMMIIQAGMNWRVRVTLTDSEFPINNSQINCSSKFGNI